MLGRLILLFILVPLVDLILLLYIADLTSWQFSIGMVVLSGIIGAVLAKMQSSMVKGQIRAKLQKNQLPAELLSDGAMIFFAAGLLLTPGFITDFFGFTLLIPMCRNWYKKRIKSVLKNSFRFEMVPMGPTGTPTQENSPYHDPSIIDGEVLSSTEGKSTEPTQIPID